jgi:hypothetical protein
MTRILPHHRRPDQENLPHRRYFNGLLRSLLKNRARQRIRSPRWLDERLRRDPLRAAGLIPAGFVAPQSKVPTFSFVAPRLVEEFLAALPARVIQRAA